MKIKQTIKTTLIGIFISVGFMSLFNSYSYAATSCAGVQTSVIGCSEVGLCANGKDPYEGSKPSGSDDASLKAAQDAYSANYKHIYGACDMQGTKPNTSVEHSGVWGLLLMVINILTAGVGIVAVAGIIYGSVMYTSAGGNPENVKKARGIITNVVIGIIAYAFMFTILNFITPGGLFN
jgi:hypothetical protein